MSMRFNKLFLIILTLASFNLSGCGGSSSNNNSGQPVVSTSTNGYCYSSTGVAISCNGANTGTGYQVINGACTQGGIQVPQIYCANGGAGSAGYYPSSYPISYPPPFYQPYPVIYGPVYGPIYRWY